MEEIKTFMYPDFCNVVADTLAAIGLNCLDGPLLWLDRVPDSVALLVTGDMPGTSV